MTQESRDFVDFTVFVGVGENVGQTGAVGTVADVVPCRSWVVFPCKGGHPNAAGGGKEFVVAFIIGVNKADRHPVRTVVVVDTSLSRESVTLNEQTDAWKSFAGVAEGHLTGKFSAGVILQNLDVRIGIRDAQFRSLIVPVGQDEVVHHGSGQRKGRSEVSSRGPGHADYLSGLWVA